MVDFDKRADNFWNDIRGIVELLNRSNSSQSIFTYQSPMITNYLLWRILMETKKPNSKEIKELTKIIKTTQIKNATPN